jgi:hypothetical protein
MAHDLFTSRKSPKSFSIGSLLIPAKQERALLSKIDDVRFDVRSIGGKVSAGLLALSAALGMLGIASIYRSTKMK